MSWETRWPVPWMVAVATAGALVAAAPPAATATTTAVPTQYVAKLYSEGLGRGPDQEGWAARLAYFETSGCSVETLRLQGKDIFGSSEYNNLSYDSGEKILSIYRTVLNREPDPAGLRYWMDTLDGGLGLSGVVDGFYDSPEFALLARSICSATSADYDFGTTPATELPITGSGYVGGEVGLQSLLRDSPPGSVVKLAPRAIVRLSRPLTIPAGVRLGTTGDPLPNQYARMGRLVRTPGFDGEAVRLMGGASLTNVWVDGGRLREGSYNRERFNVRTYGGAGTSVSYNRIGNTAGATNVEALGASDGYPCSGLTVQGNLVDAYTSQHSNGLWSDGLSIHCEDSTVVGNTVIDATDVGIIDFALKDDVPQRSQIYGNTVLQAGQSSFGMIGVDPFFTAGGGDAAGKATRSFEGGSFHNNLLWTGPRTHSTFGIIAGTKAWFGADAHNATGGEFKDNTTGSLFIRVKTAIVVSGLLDVTVTGNTFNTQLYDVGGSCPMANIGASANAGFAGGVIQGPYSDTLYSGCLDPGGES